MPTTSSLRWRIPLLIAGLFILVGPHHPSGNMAEMLVHPDWIPAHVMMLGTFLALLIALVLLRAGGGQPERTAWWLRFAIIASAVQLIETVVHTFAVVDAANLAAGRATPVLTTHLAMAVFAYPAFGLAMVGFIVAAARDRTLGSWWIAWIGIIGAAAHGAAAPLRILTGDYRFSVLFIGIAPLALWTVLAALWPLRARAAAPAGAHASPAPRPAQAAR
jgi:hypothetical protein